MALARAIPAAGERKRATTALDYAQRAAEAATETEQSERLVEQIGNLRNSL